jgi:exosortase A-associated hydrolase 1
MNSALEFPIAFNCAGEELIGIVHPAEIPSSTGVLVIVGGPQYRVGSHRQFVLLARHLARHGVPTARFDCRGMGDSSGAFPGFEGISVDIAAAIDAMLRHQPAVRRVVLWGLCDAAAAALMYAPSDRRVAGLVLLNPWVRTEQTLARTYLRHYYRERILSSAFWSELLGGKLNPVRMVRDLGANLKAGRREAVRQSDVPMSGTFVDRMRQALDLFPGPILVVLSGKDTTAAEFSDLAGTASWKQALARDDIDWFRIAAATHTFSTREWRDTVAERTEQWVKGISAG